MKITGALLALFIVIVGGGYLYSKTKNDVYSDNPSATSTPVSTSTITAYAMADVIQHNVSGDCWAVINGNVYNLTAWVTQHPGGESKILSICGKDGTSAFEAQHGKIQDVKPKDILEGFKIGTIAQ